MPDKISLTNNSKFITERWTSHVLKIGVWFSAALMITGLILAGIRPSSVITFSANPSLAVLFTKIFTGSIDPATLMLTGLVFLMLTPVMRVVAAVIGFITEKDNRFIFVSALVFLMLVFEIVYSLLV